MRVMESEGPRPNGKRFWLWRRIEEAIDREVASYPSLPRVPTKDDLLAASAVADGMDERLKEEQAKVSQLRDVFRRNFEETTKEARNVFILYISLLAYAALALANVKDKDFFVGAGVKLPVVDVQVGASAFFLVTPYLILFVTVYLHLYLGYVRRFRRILVKDESGLSTSDALFPWIGTLSDHRGPFGSLVHALYVLLVWCAAPFVLGLYWLHVLFLRATWNDLFTLHLPPHRLVGLPFVVTLALLLAWSGFRHRIDQRFQIARNILSDSRRALIRSISSAFLAGFAAIAVLAVPHWHTKWCDEWNRDVLCIADLEQAQLSTPVSGGLPYSVGVQLKGAHLRRANLHGAYLERADLSHADLTAANLMGAWLKAAKFDNANLQRAILAQAQLQDSSLTSTNLEGARMMGAQLQGAYLSEARFQRAFMGAVGIQHAILFNVQMQGAAMFASDLRDAHLTGVNLQGTSLAYANLQGSTMDKVQFEGADLSHAKLQGAVMANVTFRGADLRRIEHSNEPWQDADFEIPETLSAGRKKRVNARLGKTLDVRDISVGNPPAYCGDLHEWKISNSGYDTDEACWALRRQTLRELARSDATLKDLLDNPPGALVSVTEQKSPPDIPPITPAGPTPPQTLPAALPDMQQSK